MADEATIITPRRTKLYRPQSFWGHVHRPHFLKRLIKQNVAVDYIGELPAAFGDDQQVVVPEVSDRESPAPHPPISRSPHHPILSRRLARQNQGGLARRSFSARPPQLPCYGGWQGGSLGEGGYSAAHYPVLPVPPLPSSPPLRCPFTVRYRVLYLQDTVAGQTTLT